MRTPRVLGVAAVGLALLAGCGAADAGTGGEQGNMSTDHSANCEAWSAEVLDTGLGAELQPMVAGRVEGDGVRLAAAKWRGTGITDKADTATYSLMLQFGADALTVATSPAPIAPLVEGYAAILGVCTGPIG